MTTELEARNVTVHFGGLTAVRDASMTIQAGTVTALIGPNGAGKSTLLHVLSGFLIPDNGQVFFRGDPIVGELPHELVARGMARTFQDLEVFGKLSVAENIFLAFPDQLSDHLSDLLLHPKRERKERRLQLQDTAQIMADVGVISHAEELAENLSYGVQKQLTVGRLLATGADLLMLDEPGAGLPRGSVEELGGLLRSLVAEQNKTVLFIDHNMDLVLRFADFIYVLHHGEVIASGTPSEIRNNQEVIDVYLSRSERSP